MADVELVIKINKRKYNDIMTNNGWSGAELASIIKSGTPFSPKSRNICFHCGHDSVYWSADFDFEDYGYEGEGIVQVCHCSNCGAEIEYRIADESES